MTANITMPEEDSIEVMQDSPMEGESDSVDMPGKNSEAPGREMSTDSLDIDGLLSGANVAASPGAASPLSFGLPSLPGSPVDASQLLARDPSGWKLGNEGLEVSTESNDMLATNDMKLNLLSGSPVDLRMSPNLAARHNTGQNDFSFLSGTNSMSSFSGSSNLLPASVGMGAMVPYDPTVAAQSVMKSSDSVPAIEFSSWGQRERERVRISPPDSIDKLTDFELAYIDLQDLMRLMEKAGYSEEDIKRTKIKRRKLKNRNSARGSATKKRSQFNSIASTNKQLSDLVTDLKNRNSTLLNVNQQLQRQTEQARRMAQEAVRERIAYQQEVQRLTKMLGDMGKSVPSSSSMKLPEDVPFVQ